MQVRAIAKEIAINYQSHGPTAQDWTDLGKLPDWSGVENPKISDQDAQVKTNPPPGNEVAAKKIEDMFAEEKAGRPRRDLLQLPAQAHQA